MSPATAAFPAPKIDVIELMGGLDQQTPVLKLPAGYVRDGVNFECNMLGGYGRSGGYERFDGRAKPSAQTYSVLEVAQMLGTPIIGDTVIGLTTLTTATIIAFSQEHKYVIVTLVTGNGFAPPELIVNQSIQTGIGYLRPVTASQHITKRLNAQYRNLAADVYRALIQAVPGEGPVRGIVGHVAGGVFSLYAIRNNVGSTAGVPGS